jgi:hypothetical protein
MLISQCQTYSQSDSTTLFPTGFHVESPAVLSIAHISNKVNHDFNMSRFALPSLTKQQTVGILVLDDDFDLSSLVKQILQKQGFKNVL